MNATNDRPSLQVLERTFTILESFDEDRPEWSATEFARALDLPIPTVHRLLTALKHRGYVSQHEETSWFGASIPQREGSLAAPGLLAPVEIVRDRFGIPHIAAANEHDLYFAQGFCHAQDRLFQMEVERRLARGELAEVFGGAALPADRFLRHLGFGHRAAILAASLPPGTIAVARAYADGVNAGMESLRAWPAEFRLLGFAPRRYTVEDIAAAGLLKSFGLAQWPRRRHCTGSPGSSPGRSWKSCSRGCPPGPPSWSRGTGISRRPGDSRRTGCRLPPTS